MGGSYIFDVALSFAGADREIARVIAAVAQANGLRVFMDEHYYAESWGRNLNEYLADVYARSSRYCLVLVSQDYCEAAYTNLERRHALDYALMSRREYILPVRLDDSWLAGLPTSTAYLDLRELSATEVGAILVRKVNAGEAQVAIPAHIPGPRVQAVDDVPDSVSPNDPSPFAFGGIWIADECHRWSESREPIVYGGRDDFRPLPDELESIECHSVMGSMEDPIFDVTIINRGPETTILTAVGVVFVRACMSGFGGLGGGGGQPILLHRTYELPLPDLWTLIGETHRKRDAAAIERVELDELAVCRLPDPILMQRDQAYRYGLRLFDFVNYCPTTVEMCLWARTDLGDIRSRQIRLRYSPGGPFPAWERYKSIRSSETGTVAELWAGNAGRQDREAHNRDTRRIWHERRAYRLWEEAGRPDDSSDLFWQQAKLEMLDVHRRPLVTRRRQLGE